MSARWTNSLQRALTDHPDGQLLVCLTVAGACFAIGGLTWVLNLISPDSPDLSGLAIPGLLYSLMGAARVPVILRAHRTSQQTDVDSLSPVTVASEPPVNAIAGRIDTTQPDANAA